MCRYNLYHIPVLKRSCRRGVIYACLIKFKRLWHRRCITNLRNVILKVKSNNNNNVWFQYLFWTTEVLLLVFSVYCAFVHCINDTRVFEYDRLIGVTWRQTEQQNIYRSGRWSGRLSPLPAPFLIRGLLRSAPFFWDPLTAPLRSTRVLARSAPFSAPLTCSGARPPAPGT